MSSFSVDDDKGFNGTLFRCIDCALRSTLGEGSAQAMYFMIRDVSKKEIGYFESRPMEMLDYLHQLLGNGYFGIERIIVREVRKSFSLDETEITLEGVIKRARAKFLNVSD